MPYIGRKVGTVCVGLSLFGMDASSSCCWIIILKEEEWFLSPKLTGHLTVFGNWLGCDNANGRPLASMGGDLVAVKHFQVHGMDGPQQVYLP